MVTLKNEQSLEFCISGIFPSFVEMSFKSKKFDSYLECIKSCKTLVEDIAENINESVGENLFKIATEVNSKHSGTKNISVNWQELEVARIWIYNRTMENSGDIAAVCQACIFSDPIQSPEVLH